MRIAGLVGIVAAGALAACSSGGAASPYLAGVQTGLEGRITIGPITPVCRVDVPCDAPLAASFRVLRDQYEVARFTSESDGRYQVRLQPGPYTVERDSAAFLAGPWPQRRDVVVEPTGITHLDLDFDTGIR